MSTSYKAMRKQLSEARWHLNAASDVDANLYAAIDGLADVLSAMLRATELATEAAPVAPDHGLTGVEQASAASASGAA